MRSVTYYWKTIFLIVRGRWLLVFFFFLAGFALLNIFVNEGYVFIDQNFFSRFHLYLIIPYTIATILIAVLSALNLTLITYRLVTASKTTKSSAGLTVAGSFGGLLSGICPGCIAGLLPTLASVFGITLSASALPLLGFELLIPAIILLLVSLVFILRTKSICPPN